MAVEPLDVSTYLAWLFFCLGVVVAGLVFLSVKFRYHCQRITKRLDALHEDIYALHRSIELRYATSEVSLDIGARHQQAEFDKATVSRERLGDALEAHDNEGTRRYDEATEKFNAAMTGRLSG